MGYKELVGTVVSDHGLCTRIVTVENRVSHKSYKKISIRTRRYAVHDPYGKTQVGDVVKIQETAPVSKTKRWILVNILDTV
jgi:small subunit ribosomal protein S17